MKRCPACHKTYHDSQNFCLDDGATLVSVPAGPPIPASPPENVPYSRSEAATAVLHGVPTPGYQGQTAPPPYMMPPPARKRSPLPWILVGGLGLVAAVVGIILATRDSGGRANGGPVGSASPKASGKTSSAPAGSGTAYQSTDGRFSITLPPGFVPFKTQKTSQPSPAGPIELNILQSENPRGACVLGYSDFPEGSFVGRTEKKMLEDGRDGALKNINGTLEKQEDIKVQGKTGLAIYGTTNQEGRSIFVRFQFVLDKPRAYQIGYLAYNRADLDNADVQAYFDSFQIK